MKYIILFIFLISNIFLYAFFPGHWWKKHADEDPKKSEVILIVRATSRSIFEEKADVTDKNYVTIGRPQKATLRVLDSIKGNLKAGENIHLVLGGSSSSISKEKYNEINNNHLLDTTPHSQIALYNTQLGHNIEVGNIYLMFLNKSKDDASFYTLRSGPLSFGKITFKIPNTKSLKRNISFGLAGNKWQKPVDYEKYINDLKKKL